MATTKEAAMGKTVTFRAGPRSTSDSRGIVKGEDMKGRINMARIVLDDGRTIHKPWGSLTVV